MIRLEINPLDQKDIIELLEYAMEKKSEEPIEKPHWDNQAYWQIRIPQLIQVVKGKNVSPSIVRSSMPKPINEKETKEDKITIYF